jgi:hypothetical protein
MSTFTSVNSFPGDGFRGKLSHARLKTANGELAACHCATSWQPTRDSSSNGGDSTLNLRRSDPCGGLTRPTCFTMCAHETLRRRPDDVLVEPLHQRPDKQPLRIPRRLRILPHIAVHIRPIHQTKRIPADERPRLHVPVAEAFIQQARRVFFLCTPSREGGMKHQAGGCTPRSLGKATGPMPLDIRSRFRGTATIRLIRSRPCRRAVDIRLRHHVSTAIVAVKRRQPVMKPNRGGPSCPLRGQAHARAEPWPLTEPPTPIPPPL